MNNYAKKIKNKLLNILSEMDDNSRIFVTNPKVDFTRKRKLDFKEMIRIILSMGGQSLNLELMSYFSFDTEMPTCSAFVQRRQKILPEAFKFLFHMFTESLPCSKYYNGYRLLAVDGSDLNIAYNTKDTETYFPNGPKAKGFNLLHLNSMYDLCNRIYVDSIIQPGRKEDERKALINMVDGSQIHDKVIVIADRGYESYNVFEHITKKGWNYVIRVKDINSGGISSSLILPRHNTFDVDYSLLMTRQQTKEIKSHPATYKFMPTNQRFDYLPVGSKDTYPMNFRVVRFPISENTYEVIITNLEKDDFPTERIKEIYHMRWGIETSFRELKYAMGLTSFHSKKMEYIVQEVFARLTMYNFCEVITTHVVIRQRSRKYIYQVNFTLAIAICMHYFKYKNDMHPPDVEALIKKNILPVRPGRKDPRKIRYKSTISFLYRVA